MISRFVIAGIVLLNLAGMLPGQRVIFSDDMSSFPTGWALGSSGLRSDTWTQKANRWYSSGFSAKCTRRDTYPDSVNCWMQRPVSLTGYPMGVLSFWAWQRSEGGYDFLHFEYTTNGGTSWQTLWSRSGSYGSWRKVTLSNIPSNANMIRFRFFSDVSGHTEGVYLDDVVLYGMDTTGTTVFYDNMNAFPGGWDMLGSGGHFWGRDSFRYYSPNKSAQCAARDSGYYNSMDSRALRVISLRGSGYNSLSYRRWIDVEEDNDYLDVYYHTFGGGSWIDLWHDSVPDTVWKPFNFELPGNADSIRFRFRSDISVTKQGAYIDDVLVNDFGVRALDIAAASIISPPADNDSGADVTVSASIRNNGAAKVSVPVYFMIGDGSSYRAMAMVDSIAAGGTATVTFPNWIANVRPGVYAVKCSTAYFLDSQTSNDAVTGSITVANRDAGVVSILRPSGIVPVAPLSPQVVVRNHGNARVATDVTFRIPLASYVQTVQLTAGLPVRVDTTIVFPAWNAARGIFPVSCSTYMSGDRVRANDVLTETIMVGDTGWTPVAEVPPGYKGKMVKDGGCLACVPDDNDTGFVYALKGNNRCEFYRYNTMTNVWAARESIPAYGISGRKKAVKKGACMTQYAGTMYAAKGNNTLEYWAYTPGTWYPWRQLADVPPGAKTVKEGAGAVPVRIGAVPYIYFVKGSSTFEFYRYIVASNTWEALSSLPPGLSGKAYKNGSCIAYDSTSNTIYVLKGQYNEFFAYNVTLGTFADKSPLPFIGREGRKRKVKDGAGMTVAGGMIYVLKGGNTREFWVYQPGSDLWAQSSDYPMGGGKAVKGGGALVYAPTVNALFATKGNNTLEFSKYQLTAAAVSSEKGLGSNVQISSLSPSLPYSLRLVPNPFTNAATISFSLPRSGAITLKLYDVTGKLIATLARGYHTAGTSSFIVHRSSFSSGIYVLRLETENSTATTRLIIE